MNMFELTLASGEIFLLTMICIILVTDLFLKDENRSVTLWLSVVALIVTGVFVFNNTTQSSILIFSGSYIADPLSGVLKISSILAVTIGFIYSRDYLINNDLMKGEFFILSLFGLLGIFIMISANSLLVMYLGLETLALSLYAL
ncbi:MAG: NADH:ubiquinone oxidoreductase subunit N, partial [Pseudomonadota bacterium]|nr:NADH:ubiquinone oxidoreductase subunit N [Pseudomonadota bacterium]